MPVLIRDEHLEQSIETERELRGDGTKTKTASDLLRERLMELETERRQSPEAAKSAF